MMRLLDDILGAFAIFLLVFGGFWVGHGIGLPTGGDQLLQEVRISPAGPVAGQDD